MVCADLRDAIADSGLSSYEIAKRALEGQGVKIDHKAVSRFLKNERGITADTFSVIAEVLGLCLVKKGAPIPCEPPIDFEKQVDDLAWKRALTLLSKMGEMAFKELESPTE